MRSRRALLALALVAAGLGGAALTASPSADGGGAPPADRLVSPAETEGYVWPYTSRSRSVADRTLALNVVVHGDPERVRRVFVDRSDANWSTVDGNETVVPPVWRPAHGAVRYTYVTPEPDATGRWVTTDYQLAVGAYLGGRVHVRAYAAPSGEWTALQAHREYWDWFRLRHTVTGVAGGARFVERDVRDAPFAHEVSRTYHGLGGGGSDGWITVVDLAPAVLFAGLAAPLTTRRWTVADAALPVALAGLVVGIRAVGIVAEGAFPGVDPKLFVALGYPVVVFGPPAVVALLARDRPAARAALLAAAGLGGGVVLDFGRVGVSRIPVRLAVHRVALVAALGLFALGIARGDRRTVGVGAVAWTLALAAPLVGVV